MSETNNNNPRDLKLESSQAQSKTDEKKISKTQKQSKINYAMSESINNPPYTLPPERSVKEIVAQMEKKHRAAQIDNTQDSMLKDLKVHNKGDVKKKQYEQNKISSNTDAYNQTPAGNQGLYNAPTRAGQSKRNLDDDIPSDTITKKIRTSASYNSSLQNNNLNGVAQDPNAPPKPPRSKQVPLQGSQLYNNDQNKISSNTGVYNQTAAGNQGLYNAPTRAGQSKRQNLDAAIPSDTIKKIRTFASYNSSLQNKNVNSVVQDPNAPPKPQRSKQVPLQGSQLYNNDQPGNSAVSTPIMPENLESTASQPSSLLESSNKAADKIALGNTNHDGILQAFQALQQLLHEILAADEKYQEWQQQNPDKTPHDFQQNSTLVNSISNETKKLLEEISRSGTANIVGSSKNTPYAQANSFANKLHDLNWHNSDESNNQTVNNIFPGMVSATKKVNMPFDVNGSTQHVSKVRSITIPASLGKGGEASSAALVLLDKNGNRPPESKALYFTAHYSSNDGGEQKLTDITYPKPLQFCSDAPDSPCYVLQGNEAYFLPVNRQELQKLLKEVDLNKGIEREQVAQDKIITNSPPAQDKIITNSLQPKDQSNISFHDEVTQDLAKDNRNMSSSKDIVNVMSTNTSSARQADKDTAQSKSPSNTNRLRNVNNIATNLQKSKVNTINRVPLKRLNNKNKSRTTPTR